MIIGCLFAEQLCNAEEVCFDGKLQFHVVVVVVVVVDVAVAIAVVSRTALNINILFIDVVGAVALVHLVLHESFGRMNVVVAAAVVVAAVVVVVAASFS